MSTDFPTAPLAPGHIEAGGGAVEKSPSASHTKKLTLPANSTETSAKVVGQLLLYYTGVLHIGMRGLRMLRNFASSNSARARSCSPKLLKSLSGGISPPEDAWREFQKGKKIHPNQVGLFIALDGEPPEGLKSLLQNLAINHHLEIGVITVLGRNKLNIWKPN